MNKHSITIAALLAAASILNIGCMSSVSSVYDSAKSKLAGKNTAQTDALYSQVNEEDKASVAVLRHELEVVEQTRVLAKMEEDRDDLQQDRSKANAKRMDYLAKEKAYRVELAKLEAIDRNKLGDRATNIENITDVHVDALEVQQKRLKMDSEVALLDLKIAKLTEQINDQSAKVEELKADTSNTASNN